MTCLMRAYVLREAMLCRRRFILEYFVLVERISSGWHISQYVVFYWKTCFTGRFVFHVDIYFRKAYFAVQDVSCFTGGYALLEAIYYMRAI